MFNAAPLTRALSFLPSSLSHSYPFPLSLSSPLLPHLAVQTDPSRSLSLDRIPCARLSISPPLSDSPLALSRAEHEFGRGCTRASVSRPERVVGAALNRACNRSRVRQSVGDSLTGSHAHRRRTTRRRRRSSHEYPARRGYSRSDHSRSSATSQRRPKRERKQQRQAPSSSA